MNLSVGMWYHNNGVNKWVCARSPSLAVGQSDALRGHFEVDHCRRGTWTQSQSACGCLGDGLRTRQRFRFHRVQVEDVAGWIAREGSKLLLLRKVANLATSAGQNTALHFIYKIDSISKHLHSRYYMNINNIWLYRRAERLPAPCLRRSAAVLVLVVLCISWSSPTRSETS